MPLKFAAALLAISLLAIGCKKEFDTPPVRTLPVGSVLTVQQLRDLFTGSEIQFVGDSSVYAVVTADEQNGNLYKNIYVQDHTAAIQLRLLNPGGLYQGDSIRIYLPGARLSAYNGMLQLDSIDVDNNVVKQATQVHKAPLTVTIPELNAEYTPVWDHPLQGMLIRLDSVQFTDSEAAALTWGDALGQTTVNRTLENCDDQTVIVRNSGYANFANDPLPQGKGPFVAVMGTFGTDAQLFVRDVNEAQLSGIRCDGETLPILSKDFEDESITSGGWTQQQVIGNTMWTASFFGGERFGRISNYVNPTNFAAESWLISPAVNLSNAIAPVLSFRTASAYNGPDLEVLVSTNYTGGSPTTASWTTLNPPLGNTGFFEWVQSGDIDLTAYLQANFRVAFKYTGTSTSGKTWEVDDIRIAEQ